MKKLLCLLLFLIAGLGCLPSAQAQDIYVPIQKFQYKAPNVVFLKIRPLGGLIESLDPAFPNDSTKIKYEMPIYYELIDETGKVVKAVNITVPERLADLLVLYQKRKVNNSELAEINTYIQAINPDVVVKKPTAKIGDRALPGSTPPTNTNN